MKLLHLFIIVSLLLLILINIYNYFKPKLREGIDETNSNVNDSNNSTKYQNYDELENKDPTFLAIKNAANISYIKSQLDELKGIKQEIFDLSNNVYSNTQQLDQIQVALQDQVNSITGGSLQNPDDINLPVDADSQLLDETQTQNQNQDQTQEQNSILDNIV
jgi:hypothetical protein